MSNGSIYYDEASRGYHHNAGRTPYTRGRWVGERTVNGRRVRMRSADYSKVVKWLEESQQDNNRLVLKGFPNYSIDIESQSVYNKWGKKMKGWTKGGTKMYHLNNGKERLSRVTFNRLAYAALHGIDVRKIPHDIIVTFDDGEYVLRHRGDFASEIVRRHNREEIRFIENSLNKRKCEIDILFRFYQTGNASELTTYATHDIFQPLLKRVTARHHVSLQRATDVVTEATERFLRKAVVCNAPFTNISSNITRLCNVILQQDSRKQEYKEGEI